jgi:hypothetical protein
VEKEWRSLKYSVNSERISKNDEETINNNVRIKQLATRKNRKLDDDTKISKLHHQHPSPRCQLTENKTDSYNLKEASRNSAKQGKSIIPARRWLLSNSFYGSLNETDSTRELGPLDNTYKNTITKTRTYVNVNLTYTNTYIKNPTSTKNFFTITNKSRYNRNSKIEYKLNSSEIKGQGIGHTATLQVKVMAPKTVWIRSLITSAETELKMEPKNKWILLPAEPKLKLAPKTFWITTPVKSALAPHKHKQAPKYILIHNFIIKTKIAPNINWIHNSTIRIEFAPKITWIHNFMVKPKIAPKINWIHNFILRLEIAWIHNCAVKNNLSKLNLIPSHIELTIARTKLKSNPLLNHDSTKHKTEPKIFLIHNFTVKIEIAPNSNCIHNLTIRLEIAPKITWIHNCVAKNNLANLTLISISKMRLESNPLLKHDSITQDHNCHTTIAVPLISTHLLIQPLIFFMINPNVINDWKNLGGTGKHSCVAIQIQLKDLGQSTKPEQPEHTEHTEPPGQHPQHPEHPQHPQQELMKAAMTTDNLNMPDANHDYKCDQGRIRRREATRSTPIQEYKKKIIFKITIIACNISHYKCNMFIDSRSCTQASENEIKRRLKVEGKGRCKENVSSTTPRQPQNQTIPPCVEVTTFHFMWKAYYFTSCGKLMSTLSGHNPFYPLCVGRNFCFNYQNNIYQKINYLKII